MWPTFLPPRVQCVRIWPFEGGFPRKLSFRSTPASAFFTRSRRRRDCFLLTDRGVRVRSQVGWGLFQSMTSQWPFKLFECFTNQNPFDQSKKWSKTVIKILKFAQFLKRILLQNQIISQSLYKKRPIASYLKGNEALLLQNNLKFS